MAADFPEVEPASSWTRSKVWTVGISFIVLLLLSLSLFFRMIGPYLVALAMGGIAAVLATPLHAKLLKRGMGASSAATIVTLGVLFLIACPLIYCLNAAIEQAVVAGSNIVQNKDQFRGMVDEVAQLPIISRFFPDRSVMHDTLISWAEQMARWLTNGLMNLAASLPATLIQVLLSILTMYYGLVDGRRFINWLSDRDTLGPDVEERLIKSVHDTTVSSVWASMVSAMIQALIVFIGCVLLGVQAPFLFLFATFVASWIPLLGTAIVTVPLAIYLFFTSGTVAGVSMLAISFLCGASDNVTRPWILHGRAAIHPLVGLLGIFGGIHLFGFYGVFLGPIFTGFVVTLLELWPRVGHSLGVLWPSRHTTAEA